MYLKERTLTGLPVPTESQEQQALFQWARLMEQHMPAKWMRIVPVRKIELTEERRQALAEQMKSINESRTIDVKLDANFSNKSKQV